VSGGVCSNESGIDSSRILMTAPDTSDERGVNLRVGANRWRIPGCRRAGKRKGGGWSARRHD
jgi:hypothetical protein